MATVNDPIVLIMGPTHEKKYLVYLPTHTLLSDLNLNNYLSCQLEASGTT